MLIVVKAEEIQNAPCFWVPSNIPIPSKLLALNTKIRRMIFSVLKLKVKFSSIT